MNRREAERYEESKRFAGEAAVVMTSEICTAMGYNFSRAAVAAVVSGASIQMSDTSRAYIHGLYSSCALSIYLMRDKVNLSSIFEVGSEMLKWVGGDAKALSTSEWSEIERQLEKLEEVPDRHLRALVAFTYIVGCGLFGDFNTDVSLIIANTMLYHTVRKCLGIAGCNNIAELKYAVNVYLETDKPAAIFEVLYKNIRDWPTA